MEEAEIIRDIVLDAYEVNSLHVVDVTYIVNPHNFYVRPIKYRPVVNQFESAVPIAKVSFVNVGDMVLYNWGQSCGASKYIRGKILKVLEVESFFDYDLFAVDYGFVEKAVPLEFLWQCKEEFQKVPPLAAFCELGNCFPPGLPTWPAHSIEGFKFYAGNEQSKMLVLNKKDEKLVVKLVNSNPEDIATMLAKGAYSKLAPLYEDVMWHPTTVRKQQHFTFRELAVNDTLHVKVLAGSSLKEFYVADIGDYRRHLKEKSNITFYARQEFRVCETDMVEGMILCMRDESRNMYERGLLKRILVDEYKAIVHLVDQGIDVEVPTNILKYMPAMCLRSSVLAIFCTADETQAWNSGVETALTPGQQFLITIKKLGYQFECPHLVYVEPLRDPLGAAAISPAELLVLEEEERERAEMAAAKEAAKKDLEEFASIATISGISIAACAIREDSEENIEGAVGTASTSADEQVSDEALFVKPN
ncbi:uncharacterized protein LOC116777241 [Danaus plexippus]|nr:uncharacterized protein LOC116777241 [Danaus plexippus]